MSMTQMPADGRYECTPAELFDFASAPQVLEDWNKAVDEIERSERAAAVDDASICVL